MRLISLIVLICLIGLIGPGKAYAQQSVDVSASVGEYYLNISGFIAPNASVVMSTTGGSVVRSTVADGSGNFSFSQVIITRGFSGFCLTAVDFRRLGESHTCFSFSPAAADITMTDVFLPPTLGLSRTEITQGSPVTAFGFTMPNARVSLHILNGQALIKNADASGYYEIAIVNLSVGLHQLYARASYRSRESLTPTRYAQLRTLAAFKRVERKPGLSDRLRELLTSIDLLWFVPLLLLIIIILLRKLYPQLFPHISRPAFIPGSRQPSKMLHHWWWVGY